MQSEFTIGHAQVDSDQTYTSAEPAGVFLDKTALEAAIDELLTYVPAAGPLWVASAVGGTTAVAAVATAATGGVGLLAGADLDYLPSYRHSSYLQKQIDEGGLLLLVKTRTQELETKAVKILEKYKAHNVHVHDTSR